MALQAALLCVLTSTFYMYTYRLRDLWFRIVGLPVTAFAGHIIFYNRNDHGEEVFGFWMIYFLSLLETMLLWEGNRLVIQHFRRKLPRQDQTGKRISNILFVCTPVTIIIRSANLLIYDATRIWGYRFPLEAYLQAIFVALLFVVIIGGIYEGLYYFRMWKNTIIESEAIKRENLQTQLNALQNQINPHFLFNSLGSLSSLIDEDPLLAKRFVNEMSTVYRYVLQASEARLVTLCDEMKFINAYATMLKTRFGEGLRLSMSLGEQAENLFLPPLTLQILLENAVKHNAVLSTRPLHISIYRDEDRIVVLNNLQRKSSLVESNRMGLKNIISKYRLLHESEVIITETGSTFLVSIPLLKSS